MPTGVANAYRTLIPLYGLAKRDVVDVL